MSIWSKEEIDALKASKDETLAALGVKLEKAQLIPKERFDEVNAKQKELADQLAKIEADRTAAEVERLKKQGEFQKLAEEETRKLGEEVKKREVLESQFKDVKVQADKYDLFVKVRRDLLKTSLGEDKWLSVYENASLEDVEKLLTQITPPTTVNASDPSRKGVPPKKVEEMTGAEILQQAQRTISQGVV